MKKIQFLPIWLTVALIFSWFTGCATFDTNAFKTISATEATVDKAMSAYADYVTWERTQPNYSPQQQSANVTKVRKLYDNYRAAMNLCYEARAAWKITQDNADVTARIQTAQVLAVQVVDVIQQLSKGKP